ARDLQRRASPLHDLRVQRRSAGERSIRDLAWRPHRGQRRRRSAPAGARGDRADRGCGRGSARAASLPRRAAPDGGGGRDCGPVPAGTVPDRRAGLGRPQEQLSPQRGRADPATRPRRSRQAAMRGLLCVLLLAGCMRAKPELPILNYHSVGAAADDYTVPVAAFEEQLDWLASHGFHTVSLHDLAEWRQRRAPLPDKAIILTFDDGKADALGI